MAKKKKLTPVRVVLRVLLGFFILIVLFVAFCIVMAMQDNNYSYYTLPEEDRDESITATVLRSAAFGKEFELTGAQLNTYLYDKICSDIDKNQWQLDRVRVYFHESDSEVYARLRKDEIAFALYAKFDIEVGDNIRVHLHDAKIGELPVPDLVLAYVLRYAADSSEKMSAHGTTLLIDNSYTREFKSFSFTVTLKEFKPAEGTVLCQTNSLTREALQALIRFWRSDEGKALLGDIVDAELDRIKEGIAGYFS